MTDPLKIDSITISFDVLVTIEHKDCYMDDKLVVVKLL